MRQVTKSCVLNVEYSYKTAADRMYRKITEMIEI